MSGSVFVDTTVLVYAHDLDAGMKHTRAKKLLSELWATKPLPWISVQVLQELFVTLRRGGIPVSKVRETVEAYTHWRIVENDIPLFRCGVAEMQRWQLSLRDGLILAAARQARVPTVLSEDFSNGQDYDGVCMQNPFLKS